MTGLSSFAGDPERACTRLRELAEEACQTLSTETLNGLSFCDCINVGISIMNLIGAFAGRKGIYHRGQTHLLASGTARDEEPLGKAVQIETHRLPKGEP